MPVLLGNAHSGHFASLRALLQTWFFLFVALHPDLFWGYEMMKANDFTPNPRGPKLKIKLWKKQQ